MWVDAALLMSNALEREIQAEMFVGEEEIADFEMYDNVGECSVCHGEFKTNDTRQYLCGHKDCEMYHYKLKREQNPSYLKAKEILALYKKGNTFEEIYALGHGQSAAHCRGIMYRHKREIENKKALDKKIQKRRQENRIG